MACWRWSSAGRPSSASICWRAREADLDFEPLLRDPFLSVCRNDHPLADAGQVRWAGIAPYRFVTVGRLSGNRTILDAALADLKVRRWSNRRSPASWG